MTCCEVGRFLTKYASNGTKFTSKSMSSNLTDWRQAAKYAALVGVYCFVALKLNEAKMF